MHAMDAVKEAARRSGTATVNIGPAMGRSRSYVAVKCSKGNVPQADNLAAMLGACGFVLCAVPSGQEPRNAIVIDPS